LIDPFLIKAGGNFKIALNLFKVNRLIGNCNLLCLPGEKEGCSSGSLLARVSRVPFKGRNFCCSRYLASPKALFY
jgi:hypothetical protein